MILKEILAPILSFLLMMFSTVKDPVISANDLNHDINGWPTDGKWNLILNQQSMQLNLFSYKKSSPNHPQIIFNGTAVVNVSEHKHLGLIFEPGLSFEKHLSEKISKAKKNVGILKHLSKCLPLKTLDHMYKAPVRPHLDYCDIIYHLPSRIHLLPLGRTLNSLMEKIEIIQYQAALAITGAWQGSSRSKFYEELGWESLSGR